MKYVKNKLSVSILGIFRQGLAKVSRLSNYVAQSILVALMLVTVVDVFGRYLLNRPLPGARELNEVGFLILVFFAVAYTWRVRGHIAVDVLYIHFPKKVQIILDFATSVPTLIIVTLIAWQSFIKGMYFIGAGYRTGILHIPLYPYCFCITFGAALLALEILNDIINLAAELRHPQGEGASQ